LQSRPKDLLAEHFQLYELYPSLVCVAISKNLTNELQSILSAAISLREHCGT
jgi:hypothetical protein